MLKYIFFYLVRLCLLLLRHVGSTARDKVSGRCQRACDFFGPILITNIHISILKKKKERRGNFRGKNRKKNPPVAGKGTVKSTWRESNGLFQFKGSHILSPLSSTLPQHVRRAVHVWAVSAPNDTGARALRHVTRRKCLLMWNPQRNQPSAEEIIYNA